jgi:hypothetical protein
MPKVGKKSYPYTKAGYAAARKARAGKKDEKVVKNPAKPGQRIVSRPKPARPRRPYSR